MTNLPNSGQTNSMDNTSVTRNEFRTGMNGLLQYLAEALGNQSSYTTQAISPTAVKLNGTPTAPTPTAGDNSTKVATTAFVTNAVSSGGTTPGNGAINVNGGNGITATGDNATANQSSATTRTLSVQPKTDGGIVVDSNGVSVDWSKAPGGGGGSFEAMPYYSALFYNRQYHYLWTKNCSVKHEYPGTYTVNFSGGPGSRYKYDILFRNRNNGGLSQKGDTSYQISEDIYWSCTIKWTNP